MFPEISSWQDIAFAVGNIIFFISLLPTVFAAEKPSVWTSIPTSIVLFVFAYAFFTLSLWYGAVTSTATGTLWLILAIQKLRK